MYGTVLIHHGIKGQKWGVRRYTNEDGSLTEEGKRHVSNYRESQRLDKDISKEGQRLIDSNKNLSRDFGGKYSNVDDDEFFESTASDYGLNLSSYHNSQKKEF